MNNVEFKLEGNDTFANYFSHCLQEHKNVDFCSYQRSHFLEKSEFCLFKVVYNGDKSFQYILQEVQQTMRSKINEIEDTFEWSLQNKILSS